MVDALDDCKIDSGYRRVLPYADPRAVQWWFVRRERGGLVFARGGRCRTSKLARSLIHRAAIQARQELAAIPRGIAAHERRKERYAALDALGEEHDQQDDCGD